MFSRFRPIATLTAALLLSGIFLPNFASAQMPISDPDFCINTMADFPTNDHEARYQFFRLTEEIGRDVTPEFRNSLRAYGDNEMPAGTAVLDAIEDIANPVIRQAAPEITVSNVAYVIDFTEQCRAVIAGQINSLRAFDPALGDAEFNAVISEDALFLRQILSDSLYRLGADGDAIHGSSVTEYARALVITRDAVEFASFDAEIEDLELLFMEDLDGRLARSNDMINEKMDREVMGDSIALSDSMSDAAKERSKQERIYNLIRILGRG